ncbi:hypothetical protein M413DRAFT_354777 [Hebeloma cylindrosporum]|uniref:Uncharacterized protein n=1 Tax=Hebeloma cylindrosporum TaxID=76867 RepID=A0A0C3CK49_HEBCY|nr:hypothetical protein M413DRAFT_354777 [Hebeloma cylindrosporum h7]
MGTLLAGTVNPESPFGGSPETNSSAIFRLFQVVLIYFNLSKPSKFSLPNLASCSSCEQRIFKRGMNSPALSKDPTSPICIPGAQGSQRARKLPPEISADFNLVPMYILTSSSSFSPYATGIF